MLKEVPRASPAKEGLSCQQDETKQCAYLIEPTRYIEQTDDWINNIMRYDKSN